MRSQEQDLRNVGALETANKIYEISVLASQSTDLQEVLRAIAERILTETGAYYVGIGLVDEKRHEIVHVQGALRTGEAVPEGHRQAIGKGVAGQVVATGRPFSLPNIDLFTDYVPLIPGMKSELAVPLKLGGRVIGVLNLESEELGKFGATEQAMLQALAAPVAQAIQNADQFHRERRRRKQLSLINRVSRILNTGMELDELLNRCCRAIREQLGYGLVAMGLIDDTAENVVLRAVSSRTPILLRLGHSQPIGEGVTGEVISTGVSLVVSDVRERANYVAASEALLTEICCPLRAGGQIFGFIDAENEEPGSLDEEDLLALETIAEHISQAILNRRNLEQIAALRQDLASMVVHDLRSPVTVIQSTLQLLAAQAGARGEGGALAHRDPGTYIRHAQRACDEMLVLIDSLLELQKLESGELKLTTSLCAPADVPRSVVNRLTVIADSREITLKISSQDNLPPARLDLDLVVRVLQNLVANALKFTPPKGTVTVEAREADQATLDWRLPGISQGVLFTVTDTGPGIPEEEHQRIFEKFGVVESRRAGIEAGTGLGLAFCKQAVMAHNGAIWVENADDTGSIFSVLLPL
ncbi:MAG: GAF domain-containing protein [bacterium]